MNSPIINQIRNASNKMCENCNDCIDKERCRTCFCMNAENQENLRIGDPDCPIKMLINREAK